MCTCSLSLHTHTDFLNLLNSQDVGTFISQVKKMALREAHCFSQSVVELQFEPSSVLSEHKVYAFNLPVLTLNTGQLRNALDILSCL